MGFSRSSGAYCLFAALIVVTSLGGCSKQAAPAAAPPPASVGVVTLRSQTVPLGSDLPGRVVAYRAADVRPQVNGVILKRLFTEGGEVRAGQPLYQIDPAPYQAALDSAQATLASAQAAVVSARLLAERYKALSEANAVSKQDYANAVATLGQDEAAIGAAKANVHTAQINLTYTKVLAPLSGHIGRSAVTEGALVTANQATALASVSQLDPVYVDVTQPASVLLDLKRRFSSGQIKQVSSNEAEVRLSMDDGTVYERPGRLEFSEVTVDETTSSVTLRAKFPNPDGLLLPGLFVHEHVTEAIDERAVLVPQQGVTHNQKGEATALVVNGNNQVELRTLTAERTVGTSWLVSAGVKAGERVIVDGLQKTGPGAKVSPVEVTLPGSPAAAQQPSAAPTGSTAAKS